MYLVDVAEMSTYSASAVSNREWDAKVARLLERTHANLNRPIPVVQSSGAPYRGGEGAPRWGGSGIGGLGKDDRAASYRPQNANDSHSRQPLNAWAKVLGAESNGAVIATAYGGGVAAQAQAAVVAAAEEEKRYDMMEARLKRGIQREVDDRVAVAERAVQALRQQLEAMSNDLSKVSQDLIQSQSTIQLTGGAVEVLKYDMTSRRALLSKLEGWAADEETWRSRVDATLAALTDEVRVIARRTESNQQSLAERTTTGDLARAIDAAQSSAASSVSAAMVPLHQHLQRELDLMRRHIAALRLSKAGTAAFEMTDEEVEAALKADHPSELLMTSVVTSQLGTAIQDLEGRLESRIREHVTYMIKADNFELSEKLRTETNVSTLAAVAAIEVKEQNKLKQLEEQITQLTREMVEHSRREFTATTQVLAADMEILKQDQEQDRTELSLKAAEDADTFSKMSQDTEELHRKMEEAAQNLQSYMEKSEKYPEDLERAVSLAVAEAMMASERTRKGSEDGGEGMDNRKVLEAMSVVPQLNSQVAVLESKVAVLVQHMINTSPGAQDSTARRRGNSEPNVSMGKENQADPQGVHFIEGTQNIHNEEFFQGQGTLFGASGAGAQPDVTIYSEGITPTPFSTVVAGGAQIHRDDTKDDNTSASIRRTSVSVERSADRSSAHPAATENYQPLNITASIGNPISTVGNNPNTVGISNVVGGDIPISGTSRTLQRESSNQSMTLEASGPPTSSQPVVRRSSWKAATAWAAAHTSILRPRRGSRQSSVIDVSTIEHADDSEGGQPTGTPSTQQPDSLMFSDDDDSQQSGKSAQQPQTHTINQPMRADTSSTSSTRPLRPGMVLPISNTAQPTSAAAAPTASNINPVATTMISPLQLSPVNSDEDQFSVEDRRDDRGHVTPPPPYVRPGVGEPSVPRPNSPEISSLDDGWEEEGSAEPPVDPHKRRSSSMSGIPPGVGNISAFSQLRSSINDFSGSSSESERDNNQESEFHVQEHEQQHKDEDIYDISRRSRQSSMNSVDSDISGVSPPPPPAVPFNSTSIVQEHSGMDRTEENSEYLHETTVVPQLLFSSDDEEESDAPKNILPGAENEVVNLHASGFLRHQQLAGGSVRDRVSAIEASTSTSNQNSPYMQPHATHARHYSESEDGFEPEEIRSVRSLSHENEQPSSAPFSLSPTIQSPPSTFITSSTSPLQERQLPRNSSTRVPVIEDIPTLHEEAPAGIARGQILSSDDSDGGNSKRRPSAGNALEQLRARRAELALKRKSEKNIKSDSDSD